MNKISRTNFYMGQRVFPENLHKLSHYAASLQEAICSDLLGFGVVYGLESEIVNGFIAGISPGLAYSSQGQRLSLDKGLQVDLSSYAPISGMKTVFLGLVQYEEGKDPVVDSQGDKIFTTYDIGATLVYGETLPEEAFSLYEVHLSPVGISSFSKVFSKMDIPFQIASRIKKTVIERQTFDTSKKEGYTQGDIIWLEPETFESQTTPPASGEVIYPYKRTNFMGKTITYHEVSSYKEYALRLRSMIDNNTTNPADEGAIGTAWAIDDINSIIETGISGVKSYIVHARRYDPSIDTILPVGSPFYQIVEKHKEPQELYPGTVWEKVYDGDAVTVRTGGTAANESRNTAGIQLDAIRNITGSLNAGVYDLTPGATGIGAITQRSVGGLRSWSSQAIGSGAGFTFNASKVVPTGSENRMKNVLWNIWVRVA